MLEEDDQYSRARIAPTLEMSGISRISSVEIQKKCVYRLIRNTKIVFILVISLKFFETKEFFYAFDEHTENRGVQISP